MYDKAAMRFLNVLPSLAKVGFLTWAQANGHQMVLNDAIFNRSCSLNLELDALLKGKTSNE